MRLITWWEQAIFSLEINKKVGSSINLGIHNSKVFSSDHVNLWYFKLRCFDDQKEFIVWNIKVYDSEKSEFVASKHSIPFAHA